MMFVIGHVAQFVYDEGKVVVLYHHSTPSGDALPLFYFKIVRTWCIRHFNEQPCRALLYVEFYHYKDGP